jgi:hypothetical protein
MCDTPLSETAVEVNGSSNLEIDVRMVVALLSSFTICGRSVQQITITIT